MGGVFAAPSRDFWKMKIPPESLVSQDPDESYHELRKFVSLALKCGPTVLETLWIPPLYKEPEWGDRLIDLGPSLLSRRAVKGSYLGYAEAQMKRMLTRAQEDPKKRYKLLKHAFRLVDQGLILYTEGEMQVKVDPEKRDFYLTLGDRTDDELISEYSKRLELWEEASSPLPLTPNASAAGDFVLDYRIAHFK